MAFSSALASLDFGGAIAAVGSVSISANRPPLDITPIGSYNTAYLAGIQDTTATCDLFYESTHGGVFDAMNNADTASTLTIDFGDGTTYSGNAFVTAFTITAQAGSVTRANVSFQFVGEITHA